MGRLSTIIRVVRATRENDEDENEEDDEAEKVSSRPTRGLRITAGTAAAPSIHSRAIVRPSITVRACNKWKDRNLCANEESVSSCLGVPETFRISSERNFPANVHPEHWCRWTVLALISRTRRSSDRFVRGYPRNFSWEPLDGFERDVARVEEARGEEPYALTTGNDNAISRSLREHPRNRRPTRTNYSRGVLLVFLAMSLLCVPVPGASMPSHETSRLEPVNPQELDRLVGPFREDDLAAMSGLDENELETIRRSIVQGLGLRRIPDPTKANVSQTEYERAHREYLRKVQLSRSEELGKLTRLHVFHATEHPGNRSSLEDVSKERGRWYHRHSLFFPVEVAEQEDASVDHASLRLLLAGSDEAGAELLEVLVYLRTVDSRELLSRKKLRLEDPRDSRWLEFDSTEAASAWLDGELENRGLEVVFLREGKPVPRTFFSPVLNVFTVHEPAARSRRKRSTPEELMSLHKGRRTKCKGESKKCCRHELTVMFKDLKGFEFIVYPKTFDAGYCKGRCPPRYNPAHHHALLQSLLWKEDRKKVPKPCCAPSKLDQLMIVYFDENDSTELKVSYWKNIQVLECACS